MADAELLCNIFVKVGAMELIENKRKGFDRAVPAIFVNRAETAILVQFLR